MKKLKLLLLSIISIFAISCDNDNPKELSIIGKWEYDKVGFDGQADKTKKTVIEDYPNLPDCSKDYLLFFENHTSIEGKHLEECHQYMEAYKWHGSEKNFTLENRYGYNQYYAELVNDNTIKLVESSSQKSYERFYLLKRVQR